MKTFPIILALLAAQVCQSQDLFSPNLALTIPAPAGGGGDITTGLVGWYKMDDGASPSQLLDSAPSPNTIPNVQGAPTSITGQFNTAYSFNGATPDVFRYNSTTTPTSWQFGTAGTVGAFTICAWIKPTVSVASQAGYFNNRAASVNGCQCINDTGGSSLSVFVPHLVVWNGTSETGNFKTSSFSISLPSVVWTSVIWTYDGAGTAKCYINGVSQTIGSGTSGTATSGSYIGLGFNPWTGGVDDVRIFSRALAQADVTLLQTTQ